MWKFKSELQREITGIPNRDMTDEEFDAASAKMDVWFPDDKGSLSRCGLWEHVPERSNTTRITTSKVDTDGEDSN